MIFAMVLAGLAYSNADQGGNPTVRPSATLTRILDNWKTREKKVKTLDFAWEAVADSANKKDAGPVPFIRYEFWLDGEDRYRVDKTLFDRHARHGRKPQVLMQSSFDGTHWRTIVPIDLSSSAISRIWIGDPTPDVSSTAFNSNAMTAPILLALRPSRLEKDSLPENFRLVSERAIAENIHCVKIRQYSKHGALLATYWVDPARDDVVVVMEPFRGDRVQSISLNYQKNNRYGWIPSGWTVHNSDASSSTHKARDAAFKIVKHTINERFPPEQFVPGFPPGTVVFDEGALEEYGVAEDGSKGPCSSPDQARLSEKIHEALEQPIDFSVDSQSLGDALDFVKSRYQIPVTIDLKAFAAAGMDPAIIEVEDEHEVGIKLKALLRRFLAKCPKRVIYEVRGGALVIRPAALPR
jgi:hypothetical protein